MSESYVKKRRRPKDEVQVGRTAIRDTSLSLQAKGLLAVFMSLEDDEIMEMKYVRTLSSDGETSHRTAMKQLEEKGYAVKHRLVDEKGRFVGWETIVDDVVWIEPEKRKIHTNKPKLENHVSEVENPKLENHVSDENAPKLENPVSENHVYNHKEILKDDLKEMMIDRVHLKLVVTYPELTKEDVNEKYEYCLTYKPTNIESYLESALITSLTNKKRNTRKTSKKPIRQEIVPEYMEQPHYPTPQTSEVNSMDDIMAKVYAFRQTK